MDLRELRWAITASQHKSLRQAAEALNVRQSTLSRTLRNLEHYLGVVLFERTNGGTRPTSSGQEFLDSAQRIVTDIEEITVRLRTQARGESGRLTIGVHSSLSTGNLRSLLKDHHRRFPDVELQLVDGSSDHLISDLANSALDIAFVVEGHAKWPERSMSVWSERVVVALPEHHALAERVTIHWKDLADAKLLLPRRGPGVEFLEFLAAKLGYCEPCSFARHDVSLDRLLTLVSVGFGILLALEGATGVALSGVIFREVHDTGGPARLGFRAHWRKANCNPSLNPFLEILRERYPDLSADPRSIVSDSPDRQP